MWVRTRAIALGSIRYSDRLSILRTYTELSGMMSFLVPLSRGKRTAPNFNITQPLSLLSIAYRKDDSKTLYKATSIERDVPLHGIPGNMPRTAIALFLAELIAAAIKEEEANAELFQHLHTEVVILDKTTEGLAYFHLHTMVELSRLLGFFPSLEGDETFFDLVEGVRTARSPLHAHYISGDALNLLHALVNGSGPLHYSSQIRNELLDALLDYYRIHLQGMPEIRSHHILRDVLHG